MATADTAKQSVHDATGYGFNCLFCRGNMAVRERYHVSHETIYKSLFIQVRGVLKKELLACLRTQRKVRMPRRASLKGKGLGKIVDAGPIRERPPGVEDRAVPGHWEGDLIAGTNGTPIATLVERQTWYVMLPRWTIRRPTR